MQREFTQFATRKMGVGTPHLEAYTQHVQAMTRSVIEERATHFREIDVFSRLIMERIIFLGMSIDDHIANVIIAQLLFLESVDASKDIMLYINSPGGGVYPGLGIYDTMQYIKPDVATVCTGLAASMGAVLLAGGAKGKRSALPHARVMIHQPLGGVQGAASDMEISIRQVLELKEDLHKILAQHTGQTVEKIAQDADRDFWMRAKEAQDYGLIDAIFSQAQKNDAT